MLDGTWVGDDPAARASVDHGGGTLPAPPPARYDDRARERARRNEETVARRNDPIEALLGPLEQDVMDVVWRLGDTTVREVHGELAATRSIAYTTVMTTMTRLASKGLLARDTAGLAHRYRPAVSRDHYARDTVEDVLSWLLDRYPEPAAAYLADVVDDVDDVTLDELRSAVSRRRTQER